MSNLRQNEPPDGTMLERRWSTPQAQKPQTGEHHSYRYVHRPKRRKKSKRHQFKKTQKSRFATTPDKQKTQS